MPKTAITASPTNFSTDPPWCSSVLRATSNQRPITRRSDSGSCRSPSVVELLTSLKRTVTVLRTSRGGVRGAASGAPHALQKRASSGFSRPHAGQAGIRRVYGAVAAATRFRPARRGNVKRNHNDKRPKEVTMAAVEETIEVEVPVQTAYNQWTQFEEFPRFMEGVESVKQLDDTHLRWRAEIGGETREWNAEIIEQQPDRRIAWRATDGDGPHGVVTFRPIGDGKTELTRPLGLRARGRSRSRSAAWSVRLAPREGRPGALQGVRRAARPRERRVARRSARGHQERPLGPRRGTRIRGQTPAGVCPLRPPGRLEFAYLDRAGKAHCLARVEAARAHLQA